MARASGLPGEIERVRVRRGLVGKGGQALRWGEAWAAPQWDLGTSNRMQGRTEGTGASFPLRRNNGHSSTGG